MEYKEVRKAISSKDFKWYYSDSFNSYIVTYYTGCNKELVSRVPEELMRKTLLNPRVTQVGLNKLKKYVKQHEEWDTLNGELETILQRIK